MGAAFERFSNLNPSRSHETVFLDVLLSMMYLASGRILYQEEYEAAKTAYTEAELMGFIECIADRSGGFHDGIGEIYEHISSRSRANDGCVIGSDSAT